MMNYLKIVMFFTLLWFHGNELEAQITSNIVDSAGLKQGMWKEFKIPFGYFEENVGMKIPNVDSDVYYLANDKHRGYFNIIECIGEYKNGLRTGIWNEYYATDTLRTRVEYKDGIPLGDCKMFWPNGTLQAEFTITTCDTVAFKAYDENGNLMMERQVQKSQVIKSIYQD
jgi:antitoxin component YwqK of YwqJK toxin-antitoxin module